MNAAAKIINQSTLFNGHFSDMQISKSIYFLLILLGSIITSALLIIYVTNSYRSSLNLVEQEEQQTHFLQLQWGQLLLEQASLATPARVEHIAINQLNMSLPNAKNTLLLHGASYSTQ